MEAVVKEGKEIVRDYAFEGFAVKVAETQPEAVEFGAAQEGFAFGFEVVREIANEIDRANVSKREFLVLTIGSEQVERIDLAETRRIEVAANGFFARQNNDNLLVRGGWGAIFQFSVSPRAATDKICQSMKSMLC